MINHIVLFDDEKRNEFLPLVFTRPVAHLRMGMFTNMDRWSELANVSCSVSSHGYLEELFGVAQPNALRVNARWIPKKDDLSFIRSITPGTRIVSEDVVLAEYYNGDAITNTKEIDRGNIILLNRITDLFSLNDVVLRNDFELRVQNSNSGSLHHSNTVIGDLTRVYVHPSASVMGATLNTTTGPIYIDQNAEVMEGALIRGPFYLGDHAGVKMGAKIYGATTIGPHSKVGGEISNSVIQGYSNKGHDGFLGNSVLGEWCNLGADTNNSNLKNNYSPVQIWNYAANDYVDTGLTFCGLIMGDHSKSGINTMFNTGTVVGVCANIFGAGFPDKHIPSFSWGGADGFEPYQLNKALETSQRMMARRNVPLTPEYIRMLEYLAQLV